MIGEGRHRLLQDATAMVILGLDIGKSKFDAHLLIDERSASIHLTNDQAGFDELHTWLERQNPGGQPALHACMEATGNYGLDLAVFLHGQGIKVSVINPKQIKAFGQAELRRNKTDKLDAALIARFCRTQNPGAWTPPLPHLRDLRELVRRCAALKTTRTQELNRQKAGLSSPAVQASIVRSLTYLEAEIAAIASDIRQLIADDMQTRHAAELLRSIPGIGEVTMAVLLAEIPNIAEFEPKGLAAFAGLSPAEHSSGAQTRSAGISRIGNANLRSALYLAALSASRHNPILRVVAQRLKNAGKPNKLVLIAIARRLLVLAHAVIRTRRPFDPNHVNANPANA
jgi:transposase